MMLSLFQRTTLVWWLLIISPTLFTLGLNKDENTQVDEEDDTISVTEEEEADPDHMENEVFVPTENWKVIKDGQQIPPGLHVRINLQTGLKEAKLLKEEEAEDRLKSGPQDSNKELDSTLAGEGINQRTQLYGESDRRGVVNKRTKVFSFEEVTNMLSDVNNDSVDLNNLPRIASSSPISESSTAQSSNLAKSEAGKMHQDMKHASSAHPKDLPLSFHRDVEVMLELSGVLANKSASEADLCRALEELEFYVHQINNAKDLNVIGGLVLVVRMLNHTHSDVKSWAARVIGSASQR